MENQNLSEATKAILEDWDTEDEPNSMHLPSTFQPLQVVKVKFRPNDIPFVATVRAVHFTVSKVKYDLDLWLSDGSVDNPEFETRIYNVDSVFVSII